MAEGGDRQDSVKPIHLTFKPYAVHRAHGAPPFQAASRFSGQFADALDEQAVTEESRRQFSHLEAALQQQSEARGVALPHWHGSQGGTQGFVPEDIMSQKT